MQSTHDGGLAEAGGGLGEIDPEIDSKDYDLTEFPKSKREQIKQILNEETKYGHVHFKWRSKICKIILKNHCIKLENLGAMKKGKNSL